MSTVLHPVGPQPDRVYWVRRLVVLAVLVVVVSVGLALVRSALASASAGAEPAGPDDAAAAPTEAADTAADDTATDDAAADDTATDPGLGPVACAPADLTLALTADATSYPAGTPVGFTVSLTNTGASACTVDAADVRREVVITSGSDRIWSSLDCPPEGGENLQLLASGARVDSALTWERTRSAPGCPADLPAPRPGTYSATATMHGATSAAAVFDLG